MRTNWSGQSYKTLKDLQTSSYSVAVEHILESLLFRAENASHLSDAEIIEEVQPVVKRLNTSWQAHAAISQSMLIPLPYSEAAVNKSNKGAVLRKKVEERYEAVISKAYDSEDPIDGVQANENLIETIQRIVEHALPRRKADLTPSSDLYAFGVDSIAVLHILRSLQKLLPKDADRLSVDVIDEYGSVECLAAYLEQVRSGRDLRGANGERMILLKCSS